MSLVTRKDTQSLSSHCERHVTKIKYNDTSGIIKNKRYKNLGVPSGSKKHISDLHGKLDFHSVSSPHWTLNS